MNEYIFSKGRRYNRNLESPNVVDGVPEEQLLDHLLDHYADEIYPNYFFLSSFDSTTRMLGYIDKIPRYSVKVGRVYHLFNEMLLQADFEVHTDIYINHHQYENVFAIFIKPNLDNLKGIITYEATRVEYAQTNFFRDANCRERLSLIDNPKMLEMMLLLLFFQMGITADSFAFTPSRTAIGKSISKEFVKMLDRFYDGIDNLFSLSKKLSEIYPSLFTKNQ